ncbi:MAG: hypothetical protein VR74_05200 [Hyphomonas sp. BRH_c22]|uniref:class I SAM-dependent DNA methyltransferase n=1 Tax=Hyphomonas sp. BRH_c22 TaxID=1629710 RepID=UPI0005F13EC1|nr:DNA methyltransferase [Hyphomonas sp. BRH_c22]KJS38568.1 MAG: hypothetical protein VR74_05200 [Hyphomonas sp. BRH_c22]
MHLNFNEIRARAATFAAEWEGAGYEKGETQSFYNDFFEVFGVKRRSVARYEEHVKKLNDKTGFIDLFWPGVLLVEQKSAGRDLTRAYDQAGEYFDGLKETDRPRFILVSDFQTFELVDLDEREHASFTLADLHKNVEKLSFILGVQKRSFKDQDPVNIKAAARVGKLHDALEDSGYTGHDLEKYLVRLVFCLFADDTGVFEPRGMFLDFLETRTSEDGADLGGWIAKLFEVLDTPHDKRSSNLDHELAQFPYINGALFSGATRIPDYNAAMREALIEASAFDWSPISPAIFGSLFQSVMNREERRKAGAHYTTEKNILKVIGPLFMDELRAEFDRISVLKIGRVPKLQELQDRLASMRILDPACGCGNFLVIAYREMRLLEIDILQAMYTGSNQLVLDVAALSKVDVDQFSGIEIGEFASRIAETAMWMMDHIMNNRLSLAFGKSYLRIPLKKSPHIIHANALDVDWSKAIAPEKCTHILGNPPFIGHQWREDEQQADMHRIWGTKGQGNRLDYVTCWFRKAVDFASTNQKVRIAFVATNSISQGEQASILWSWLYPQGAHVFFAHRTFQWESEAAGKAAVHCVIVGLTFQKPDKCVLYDYPDIKGEPVSLDVSRINAYLVNAEHIIVPARTKAPQGFPKLHQGSKPADGARLKDADGKYITTSNLILDEEERNRIVSQTPTIAEWLRPYVGGDELLTGKYRWCLWLKDIQPADIKASSEIQNRLARVKAGRLKSPTASVREYANTPWLFTQDRQPKTDYIAVPEVSSEKRDYIPLGFLKSNVIGSNKLLVMPGGEKWLFALMSSAMHMAWVRTVAGRLKSDYSYAPTVYNSFPWPAINDADKIALEKAAIGILDARKASPTASLADLYNSKLMPAMLRKAHQANDKLVERLYQKNGFKTERERIEHLFALFIERQSPIEKASSAKSKTPKKPTEGYR